jgi:hypothetical protein
MAPEVDPHRLVPLVLGHVGDRPVAQDRRVVDEHVEATERVERGPDELAPALPVGAVVAGRHRLTAGIAEAGSHDLGGVGVVPAPVVAHPEVVHHDARTFGREELGVGPPDAAGGAGDDRDAAFE